MTLFDEPRTLGEKYARATVTNNLTLDLEDQSDADKLLAAGFALARNERGQMALSLYRLDLNHICTRGEYVQLLEWGTEAVVGWSAKHGRWKVHPSTAREISHTVVRWWIDATCTACEGRKFELVPGTQLVSTRPCEVCQGFGKPGVETRLQVKRQPAGRWLADEYRSMLSYVFGTMAGALSQELELPDLSNVPLIQEHLVDLRSTAAESWDNPRSVPVPLDVARHTALERHALIVSEMEQAVAAAKRLQAQAENSRNRAVELARQAAAIKGWLNANPPPAPPPPEVAAEEDPA